MIVQNRMASQRNLVKRMASIATRAVPDNKGVHLRFINRPVVNSDNLNAEEIESSMAFEPEGGTRIGTNLEKKILKPFIYDVLDRGDKLERPYLILTITDGSPQGEEEDRLRNAMVECSRKLVKNGYKPDGKSCRAALP